MNFIEDLSYDKENRILEIIFSDDTYLEYLDVPETIFNELNLSDSKNEYYAKFIENKFEFNEILIF